MSDLLLELFSEEIPAGMQARAGEDLARLVCGGLKEAGLEFEAARNFAGPRRLTLVVEGLPDKSPDISEERKGPRVGSPDKAVEGFLRAAGLESIGQAEVVSDSNKGDFYVAKIEKPGRATSDVIAEIVPAAIRQFPWPKSQRWGAGRLRWVRPLHSILCVLGGKTVPFEVDGIASGNETRGHRFMSPDTFKVKDFDHYEVMLRKNFVILQDSERQSIIFDDAQSIAVGQNLEVVEDHGLLAENSGLTEWPVVHMGDFDESFLTVPPEVIVTAIKKHQKCFSVQNPKTKKLVNRFILVANIVADDGGKEIVDGNERVIRARLSDAKFFWDQDRKVKLEDRLPELKDIIFHEKLGTQAERVERLKALARELAPTVGADLDKAERAAELCKADLVTGMVGEFPDLQGLIGKYYALDQGEDASVAAAIEEHYRPQGPNDAVPTDPVPIAVALADKLDTLVGFWAIDEKPTGSRDPYALRRSTLGVIRILLDNKISCDLWEPLSSAVTRYRVQGNEDVIAGVDAWSRIDSKDQETVRDTVERVVDAFGASGLQSFMRDRLSVQLRQQGNRYDLVDAVFSLPNQRNLLMIVARVEALGKFLNTDDGANLLAGVKRAANILRIEEKKDGKSFDGSPDVKLLKDAEEKALASAINEATKAASTAIEKEDFEGAMSAMAGLRKPVDAFFDNVTVNTDDKALRENRLKLLNRIREATLTVADFSRIEG